MTSNLLENELPQAASRPERNRFPTITIIKLVNAENTTRPFLRTNEEPYFTMANFDKLINKTPFQKFSSRSRNSSPARDSNSTAFSSRATSLVGSELYSSKQSSEPRSASSILKHGSRSRFSSSEMPFERSKGNRRVTIATNVA